MIGLIPGVPGVHGAVEDRGPGEREWYLKSLEWYAATELLLRDTLDCFFNNDGCVSQFGSIGAFLQQKVLNSFNVLYKDIKLLLFQQREWLDKYHYYCKCIHHSINILYKSYNLF